MQSTATYTTPRRREERGGLNGKKQQEPKEEHTVWSRKRQRKQVNKHIINYSSALETSLNLSLMFSGPPEPLNEKFPQRDVKSPGLRIATAILFPL